MGIYHADEWESCGHWYCNDTSDLGHNSGAWWHPVRIMKMTPAEFVKWLHDTYSPQIFHNEDCSFVGWYWNSQAQMRKYKRFINAQARLNHYTIEKS